MAESVRNRLKVIDATTHGMTSQKKSSYGHLFRSPSSPLFFSQAPINVWHRPTTFTQSQKS